MQLGFVGLGKMGNNMRVRIALGGHTVIGYDRNPDLSDVGSLKQLIENLATPRIIWVMVPAGDSTRETIKVLSELLSSGDLVIDGSNSRWTDDPVHAALLGTKGIGFLDVGVSGGIWGRENGYALMVGGNLNMSP